MGVITPRNGDTLARVVQTALNVAGRDGVSIETGGTGNGVRVPDEHQAAIEAALGWTDAEVLDTPAPTTQEPTPPPTQVSGAQQESGSDSSDPDENTTSDPEEEAAAAPAAAPAKKTTAKKTTSNTRRARRGKEG